MSFLKKCNPVSILFSFGVMLLLLATRAFAGEADIVLPDLSQVTFNIFGGVMSGLHIMYFGLVVCLVGLVFAAIQYSQTKNTPAHKSMLDVSDIIWETCKSYLAQQGKFLIILWVLIAICIVYYFMGLQGVTFGNIIVILFCSVL